MLTAKCPHCDATLHCRLERTEVVVCSNCGEQVDREDFKDDGVSRPEAMSLELENAKSLRSIAMSLQVLAMAETPPQDHDETFGEYYVGPLEGD